jgi:hypothetical protein
MTHTPAQAESADTLGDVLNKLVNARAFSGTDIAVEREKLNVLSQNFNASSAPAAEKLAEALPKIKDYGARWIAARMLRDSGLVSETKGEYALKPLSDVLSAEKDAGMRYMFSDLLRDIGLKHENLAPKAAKAISETLVKETDNYARSSEAGALMALALKNETAASAAMEGVAKVLDAHDNPLGRITYSGKVRDLGLAWPSQAQAAMTALTQAAQKETDFAAMRQIAQNIAAVGLENGNVAEKAIKALAAGVKRSTKSDGVAAYSYALSQMGQQYPLPVIAAINKDYEGFAGKEGDHHRRMSICTLSHLADKGPMEAGEASRVLMKALKNEPDGHHRRLIFDGLMNCVHNGVDERTVRESLKEQLLQERDREALDKLERNLRSLGYIRPVTGSAILAPVAQP